MLLSGHKASPRGNNYRYTSAWWVFSTCQDTLFYRALITSYCRAAKIGSTLEFHLLLFCFLRKFDVDVYLNFLGPGRFFSLWNQVMSSCFPYQTGQVWLQTFQNIMVWSLSYFCLLLFCLLQCMCYPVFCWGLKPCALNIHWVLPVCQMFLWITYVVLQLACKRR